MRRRTRFLPALVAAAALAAACSSSSGGSHAASPPSAANSGGGAAPTIPASSLPITHPTVWLCKPGLANNPCDTDLSATVVGKDGTTSREAFTPAKNPPIDCFYVYPTVSTAAGANAPLKAEPDVTSTTLAQAARFSSVCRLYVPVYRQLTLRAITGAAKLTADSAKLATQDVVSAWHDYLQHDNDGRGVVLIGHSQGSGQLENLISSEIDDNPAERSRLVSAILLGGNVQVPVGKDVGGEFQHVPACRSDTQIGCVIAYSTFAGPPPKNALFGEPGRSLSGLAGSANGSAPATQTLCTNPADLGGGGASAELTPYVPTAKLSQGNSVISGSGAQLPAFDTAFTKLPDYVSGKCTTTNGATVLLVDFNGTSAKRPMITTNLPPSWGLHLVDVNIALGDLVNDVSKESAAYRH